jgi:membrane protease subunit (stomatin/prohibitin family)
LDELSKFAFELIQKEFDRFGLELVNFNIESINIPEEEMEKIQKVFEKTLEAKELSKVNVGQGFSAIKTFEVLNSSASNQSEGSGLGAMLGAGIGLGAGLPIGGQLGQSLNIQNTQSSSENIEDPQVKLKKLKDMLDENLITEEQFNQKREEILSKI